MNKTLANALKAYVTNVVIPQEENITRMFASVEPLQTKKTLYRGQTEDELNSGYSFFSTSTSKKIAREEFAGSDGYVFEIHVQPGIRVLPVNQTLALSGINTKGYKEEEEYLVEGGGIFYADKEKSQKGFSYLGNNEYKTFYFPNTTTNSIHINANTLFQRIPKGEYWMINSLNDLKTTPGLVLDGEQVTNNVYQNVFNKIPKSGGARRTRKIRRIRKRTMKRRQHRPLKNRL
jgi:hypothetical protein